MVAAKKDSELILNPDGSIYHLHLKPEHLAPRVVLVGDPQRVEVLSSQFDNIEVKVSNREFITHTGTYKGKRVTVLGTGIGTDNIDIVMNELDALVNIDLETRQPREKLVRLNIVRLGTTGALHGDIPVGSFIASEWGLGLDALLHFYKLIPGIIDEGLTRAVQTHTEWNITAGEAYAVKGSEKLLATIAPDMHHGITMTAPGFYGPQGRMLRLEPASPYFVDSLGSFEYKGKKISNFEMETSALYGLGKLLGHQTLTVCVAIANRVTGEFSQDYKTRVKELSTIVLDRLTGMTAN